MPFSLSREQIADRIEKIRADMPIVAHCSVERPCEIVSPDDPVFGGRPLPRLNAVWRCPVCGLVEYAVGAAADVSGTLADPEVVRLRARVVVLRRRLARAGPETAAAAAALAPVGSVGRLGGEEAAAVLARLVGLYTEARVAIRAKRREAKARKAGS